jgi:hypothetical protein
MAPPVPESVLKRRKRDEDWAAKKAGEASAAKTAAKAKRKDIFKRAEKYVKEYRDQVPTAAQTASLSISQRAYGAEASEASAARGRVGTILAAPVYGKCLLAAIVSARELSGRHLYFLTEKRADGGCL